MIAFNVGECMSLFNTYVLSINYADYHDAVFEYPMGENLGEPFKLRRFVEGLLVWHDNRHIKNFSSIDFSHIFNGDACGRPEMELEEFKDTFWRGTWDINRDCAVMMPIHGVTLTYWDVNGVLHQIEIERITK